MADDPPPLLVRGVMTAGVRTVDLGGHAGTTEFTDEVIGRVRAKLEAWSTLGAPT